MDKKMKNIDLDSVNYYIEKVKELNDKFEKENGRKRTSLISTHGCREVAVRLIF